MLLQLNWKVDVCAGFKIYGQRWWSCHYVCQGILHEFNKRPWHPPCGLIIVTQYCSPGVCLSFCNTSMRHVAQVRAEAATLGHFCVLEEGKERKGNIFHLGFRVKG